MEAAARELASELEEGRGKAHFERRFELQDELRAGYAELLGAAVDDIALTTSTSEGLGKVLAGMEIGPGDEIVTSDEEHPGLIGPLIAARERGAEIRAVPFAQLADAVGPRTTAVACSHVNWRTGEIASAALADAGVPVILDGAQGAGAIPVDVVKLGCAAYAAAGQKWLCGADGTGLLYLAPAFRDRVRALAPSYISFEDASLGFDSSLKPDARRHDTPSLPRESLAFSAASLAVLREADLAAVLARGPALAATLRRAARRPRPHGRAARPHHARRLRGRRPGDHARPPLRRRRARAQPPRHPARARLRRRVVERGRPRAPARCALGERPADVGERLRDVRPASEGAVLGVASSTSMSCPWRRRTATAH